MSEIIIYSFILRTLAFILHKHTNFKCATNVKIQRTLSGFIELIKKKYMTGVNGKIKVSKNKILKNIYLFFLFNIINKW